MEKVWHRGRFIVIIGFMKRAPRYRPHRRPERLTWLLILLLLAACNPPTEVDRQEPTLTATRAAATRHVASPTATQTPVPATPTRRPPTSTPVVQPANLSKPLYLLSDKAVWVIRPGETVVQRLTPPEMKVTAFDIGPGGDRLVYGTDTGQVYLARDTSQIQPEPLMLFDAFPEAPYLVQMDSLSWSPDGGRLAFSVDYSSPGASQTAGYPSPPSGLWLYEMETRQATWVESNRYLSPQQSDIRLLRRLVAGDWSPDETALLFHEIFWEGSDFLLLETDGEENQLVDPPGELWGSASWSPDSQSFLLSGRQNSSTSDLLQVYRDDTEPVQLIDGQASELYVYEAVELPAGTAFLANCENCSPAQTRLYMGHRINEDFVWTPVNMHQNCTGGAPRHIEWDREGLLGAMDCGSGELHIIQFRIDDIAELDISSYLNPLGKSEIFKLAWGGGD